MSGYTGNPDSEAEHALIIAENGVHAARQQLVPGRVYEECQDCFNEIPQARREAFINWNVECKYCVHCAPKHEKRQQIKMLDRIL